MAYSTSDDPQYHGTSDDPQYHGTSDGPQYHGTSDGLQYRTELHSGGKGQTHFHTQPLLQLF